MKKKKRNEIKKIIKKYYNTELHITIVKSLSFYCFAFYDKKKNEVKIKKKKKKCGCYVK